MNFNNSSHAWCTLIIDQLVKAGLTDFFTCPGMRNAPLLKAIFEHPMANSFNGFDERAQSYRALGFMKAHQRPAVLVCTSGTAVANFLPAVIEAGKSNLPLMVISADRPGELNATDANQTINQVEVLRDYTSSFWQASEPQTNFPPRALAGKLAFHIHEALSFPQGPLHINLPLREPLDHTKEDLPDSWVADILSLLKMEKASLQFPKMKTVIDDSSLDDLTERILKAKRPLVVFGPPGGLDDYDIDSVKNFIQNYRSNFSCDVSTGLKYQFGSEDGLLPTLDHPEVLNQLEKHDIDLVIHFGHRITSKHYYSLLTKLATEGTCDCFHISDGHLHEDPGFGFTHRWSLRPRDILKALAKRLQATPKEDTSLIDWNELIQKKRAVIEDGQLSYPFITKRAVDTLIQVEQVFIGNSTFIRSFDSYAGIHAPKTFKKVIVNRGASGIEGHLSMALGMGDSQARPSALFLGDVSFIHDMSALVPILLEERKRSRPTLIVVANNGGGGIFNLLPISAQENNMNKTSPSFMDLLTTPHQVEFTPLVKSLNLPAKQVSTKEEYQEALDQWNQAPQFLILEILFKDQDNVDVYKELKTVKL